MSRRRIVLCEGYDDRGFLAGLLVDGFRCTEARSVRPPKRGSFIYQSLDGAEIEVTPVGGGSLADQAEQGRVLIERPSGIDAVVLLVDADRPAGSTSGHRSIPGSLHRDLDVVDGADGWARVDPAGRNVRVRVLEWWSPDAAGTPGVPDVDSLDRLVCAALAEAHPERIPSLEAWLDAQPAGDRRIPKQRTWSHYAKWWTTDHKGDYRSPGGFHRALWRDGSLRPLLERRLRAGEALSTWLAFERIAGIGDSTA